MTIDPHLLEVTTQRVSDVMDALGAALAGRCARLDGPALTDELFAQAVALHAAALVAASGALGGAGAQAADLGRAVGEAYVEALAGGGAAPARLTPPAWFVDLAAQLARQDQDGAG